MWGNNFNGNFDIKSYTMFNNKIIIPFVSRCLDKVKVKTISLGSLLRDEDCVKTSGLVVNFSIKLLVNMMLMVLQPLMDISADDGGH